MFEFGKLMGGRWLDEGDWMDVLNPQDGSMAGRVRACSSGDVAEALSICDAASETIRSMPVHERAGILERTADIMEERTQEAAEILRLEAGKPILLARGEVGRAVATLRITADAVREMTGTVRGMDGYPQGVGLTAVTRRFPVGPVAAISPFNFPLNLVTHKVAPALAAGCPVVHKPARKTPMSACFLARTLMDAGLPEGAYGVLPCGPREGEAMATDPRIALLTFTGSAQVGWDLKAKCPRKKVVLELGGNAAAVVEPDADLKKAARSLAVGAYAYAGQVCISVQRVFVHEAVADELTRLLLEAVEAHARVGATDDPAVIVGPMISGGEADRVERWVAEAVEAGAYSLTGPLRREGNTIWPVLLRDVPRDAKVSAMEVFGPVAVIEPYRSFDEALALVNGSDFGLQAGVFTRDIGKAMEAFERLEVGGVVLNDAPTRRVDHMPYGGVKESGDGREGPRYALEHMTEERLLLIAR